MNSLANCIENYLFITNSTDDYLHKLYKMCLLKAAGGDLVLILTSELYDFSETMEQLSINKDQLSNLVIINCKTIDEISHKLLQLHSWSLQPIYVALDLFHLIQLESTQNTFSTSLMQRVTLSTVALMTYLQSIALQQNKKRTADKTSTIHGLLILTSVRDDMFCNRHIQIIIDLYFYNAVVAYHDFDDISSKLFQIQTAKP